MNGCTPAVAHPVGLGLKHSRAARFGQAFVSSGRSKGPDTNSWEAGSLREPQAPSGRSQSGSRVTWPPACLLFESTQWCTRPVGLALDGPGIHHSRRPPHQPLGSPFKTNREEMRWPLTAWTRSTGCASSSSKTALTWCATWCGVRRGPDGGRGRRLCRGRLRRAQPRAGQLPQRLDAGNAIRPLLRVVFGTPLRARGFEEELDALVGYDNFFEHEPHELLALGEGHVLQPGGDLLAEVANAPFQLPLCGAASLFEFSDPSQLGHPLLPEGVGGSPGQSG